MLLVARFVNRLGAFSLPFLAVLLVQDHGATPRLAGLVVGAFGLATIPSRLVGGRLSTRVGTKATVMIGLAGTAGAQVLVAVAPSLPVVLAGAVLLGLCFEIYEPASQGLVADVTPEPSRPRAFGLLGATLALAGLLAGLLAAAVGRVDLSWLFVADAVSALAALVLVAVWLPTTPPPRTPHRPTDRLPSPWQDPRLLLLMTTGTTFATVYMIIPMAMPLALVAAHRPASDAGLLQALAALVIIAAQPVLRRSENLTGRVVAGYGLLAVGPAVAGLQPTVSGYVAATIVIALGDVLLLGYSYALVAALAPPGARAAYFAVYGTTWGIALTVGPPAMGQLLESGLQPFWLACCAVMLATGVAQMGVNRVLREPLLSSAHHPAGRTSAGARSPR